MGGVPVQMWWCSGTDCCMFRYMPRAGYRSGEKRVDVWLSLALNGRMRGLAEVAGLSVSDWVAEAVREKVERDAAGRDREGVRGDVGADSGGSRPVEGADGESAAGERSADGGVPFLTGAQRLHALVNAPSVPVPWVDAGRVGGPGAGDGWVDPAEGIA